MDVQKRPRNETPSAVTDEHIKMLFDTTPDGDGYPPVAVEGIWVAPVDGVTFSIENIPFYVHELSIGDIVSGEIDAEQNLRFQSLVSASGNSTFRVIVHEARRLDDVRTEINALGVTSEVDRKQHLIAIDVPHDVRIEPLLNHLMHLREVGVADFEEGALRHALNDSVQ